MFRTFLFLLAMLSVAAADAAGIEGHWAGTWTKAGDPLSVRVVIAKTNGGYAASFDSDALQVAGIPFAEVALSGGRVRFVLQGDATTTVFEGALAGDAISGTFIEGDQKGTFELARTVAPPAVDTREVAFANGAVKLAGELLVPEASGRRPAILFLHGSGAEGRWASRYLAKRFAGAGFVALIADKRGVGASTGDWREAGFDDLASDAVAGLRVLAAMAEVDPARIGIYGHSQGGTIAPLVAERAGGLAFVIASAASGLNPAETEIYSIENAIGLAKLAPADANDAKRFVREIVDVAYHGKSRATLDAMTKEFEGRAWHFDPPPPEDYYWRFSRRIAAFRPLDHWRKVKAPVLIVFGGRDERVPPKESMQAIATALKAAGNPRLTQKTYPNADHTFALVARQGGWRKRVPDYADTLIAWASAS